MMVFCLTGGPLGPLIPTPATTISPSGPKKLIFIKCNLNYEKLGYNVVLQHRNLRSQMISFSYCNL